MAANFSASNQNNAAAAAVVNGSSGGSQVVNNNGTTNSSNGSNNNGPINLSSSSVGCSAGVCPSGSVNPPTISKARTSLNLVRCEQLWSIENFSQADIPHLDSPNRVVTLRSPNFYNPTNPSLQFCLKLYPREYNETFKDYVSVFVHWDPTASAASAASSGTNSSSSSDTSAAAQKTEKLPIGYKFAIVNEKGQKCNAQFSRCKYVLNSLKGYGLPGFIKRDQLIQNSTSYLPNDVLTIYCEVTYVNSIKMAEEIKPQFHHHADGHGHGHGHGHHGGCSHGGSGGSGLSSGGGGQCDRGLLKLSEDLDDLWTGTGGRGRESSDVVLQVGRRQMHVHKVFLMNRSKVFAALFDADMREKRENKITITDISWDVLNELMRYIYTGQVRRLPELAQELLAAAEKYDIQHLKALCEDNLCQTVTETNAKQLKDLADMYNAGRLREKAFAICKEIEAKTLKSLPFDKFNEVVSMMQQVLNRPATTKSASFFLDDDDDDDEEHSNEEEDGCSTRTNKNTTTSTSATSSTTKKLVFGRYELTMTSSTSPSTSSPNSSSVKLVTHSPPTTTTSAAVGKKRSIASSSSGNSVSAKAAKATLNNTNTNKRRSPRGKL